VFKAAAAKMDLERGQANSSSQAFQRNLNINTNRLLDSYRTILQKSFIQDSTTVHDDLAAQSAAAAIVFHSQAILDQIHELRVAAVLADTSSSSVDAATVISESDSSGVKK
jgi:hypothetical protein